jgi:hypothetical protein
MSHHAVVRTAAPLARLARRVVQLVAFVLFLVVALIAPFPIFARPRPYEHAGRQNEPTEVEKRRPS